MKVIIKWFVIISVLSLFIWAGWRWSGGEDVISPLAQKIIKEKPLDKYSFARLSQREPVKGVIEIGEVIIEQDSYTSYFFSFMTQGKKVTGQLNIPEGDGPFPAVIMLRGYVPAENYTTGTGTKSAAGYFASRGYVTIAPDFLGYGGSDEADEDTFVARVKRPETVLDLLDSLSSLEMVNQDEVVMWGHSNGGQIGISALEIMGESIHYSDIVKAVSFWAPVTKAFPYSILYYTDESDDRGKALRKAIASFESEYDVFDYSLDRYLDWIDTPIQIHQGTADDAVPYEWSDEWVEAMEELEKDVVYYRYPGADHNMRPVWGSVVSRDLTFYLDNLGR